MNLARGTRLGPYEIIEPLGAGGMGEVYRATDTRLRRDVAVKFVAARWQEQPNLRSLFLVEAEAIAALNHPNICQIYDIGTHHDTRFIVMEVVEGETLAARLSRGPLPIEQALRVAAEIAGALGAAHRAGIVHRDLKPANVILSRDGAKLLDFGLAQLNRPPSGPSLLESTVAPGAAEVPASPVGTWHYMSPEQIRGEVTEARSDVFALGALMYELVAGRRAFDGATHQELVAAILAADPVALDAIVPDVPEHYARIVRICLSQRAEDRWHSAADVRRALDASAHDTRRANAEPVNRAARSMVFAATVIVAFIAGLFMRSTAPATHDRNLVLSTLDLRQFAVDGAQGSVVFAVDGKSIIYAGREVIGNAGQGARKPLYRYWLATGKSDAIVGTEGGRTPFVSPDGRWLGFEENSRLMRVPIGGGQPVEIVSPVYYKGVSWGDDDSIVLGGPPGAGLQRVSPNGGPLTPVTTMQAEDAGKDHRHPVVLPGSRVVLFAVGTGQGKGSKIVAMDLQTRARRDVVPGTMAFRYAPSGHIVYAVDGNVFAVPFDAATLTAGDPTLIAEGVVNYSGFAEFAVSTAGDLAFVPGLAARPVNQLTLVTPKGEMTPIGPLGRFESPRFSPDGTRIIVNRVDVEMNEWMYDLRQGTFGQVTFGQYVRGIWHSDSSLTLSEGRPVRSRLINRSLAPSGEETSITEYVNGALLPVAWVNGGRRLIFERHVNTEGPANIWSVEPGTQPRLEVATKFRKEFVTVSPDGRWLSYTSAENEVNQVYLQRLDTAAPRVQVSVNGGNNGAWSPDSRRFYFHGNGTGPDERQLWSVRVGDGAQPVIGAPVEHFKIAGFMGGFDMSPDAQRFVIVRNMANPIQSLRLLENWPAALEAPRK